MDLHSDAVEIINARIRTYEKILDNTDVNRLETAVDVIRYARMDGALIECKAILKLMEENKNGKQEVGQKD